METQSGRALVIEPDEPTQALCRRVLEELGFAVEVSDDGTRAAHLMAGATFDLLLLDLHTTGDRHAGLLQRHSGAAVVLIGDDTGEAPSEAQGILFKPLTPTALRSVVSIALANAQARRQADRLARINDLNAALLTARDLDRVIEVTADWLQSAAPVARGWMLLGQGPPAPAGHWRSLGAPPLTPPSASDLVRHAGVMGQVLADGQPRLRPGAWACEALAPWERQLITSEGQALLCVALKVGDLIEGAIEVVSRAGQPFRTEDCELLNAAAAAVALAIERMREHSQHQRLDRQNAQSEKLTSMGRLTAAIAHEINNPLQAISNSLHLLLNRPLSQEKRDRYLSLAQREVEHLIAVVQRMLDVHRPAHGSMRPLSAHTLLEGVLLAIEPQLQSRGIVVKRDWAERLPRVLGIGSHLKQVFLNLAINAIEAMPEGGRLTIRTSVGDGYLEGAPAVLIEFADTGPGISDAQARAIFEPFYTADGQGVGLGLAISYSIVEQHGGALSVSSDQNGTTLRVALPLASEA